MQQNTGSLLIMVTSVLVLVFARPTNGLRSDGHLLAQSIQAQKTNQAPGYRRTLHFNVYTFTVETPDTGAVRMASVGAWRGDLLLTRFTIPVDGAVVGTEVADLDANRFPEVYVFSRSNGSGSFGRVYGWQFLPERKADIIPLNWQLPADTGYMGHDSLWLERDALYRQFPRYQSGDANASPTGGTSLIRYKLYPAGQGYALNQL